MSPSLTLNERELEVLRKAVSTCLTKCRQGGAEAGCEDCATLEAVQRRLEAARVAGSRGE